MALISIGCISRHTAHSNGAVFVDEILHVSGKQCPDHMRFSPALRMQGAIYGPEAEKKKIADSSSKKKKKKGSAKAAVAFAALALDDEAGDAGDDESAPAAEEPEPAQPVLGGPQSPP